MLSITAARMEFATDVAIALCILAFLIRWPTKWKEVQGTEKNTEQSQRPSVTTLAVGEPWLPALATGTKAIEGRLHRGKFAQLRIHDVLAVTAADDPNRDVVLHLRVVGLNWYESFESMLSVEGIAKVLPGVSGIEDGVGQYRKYYSPDEETAHGVLAIKVHRIHKE